MTDDNKGIKFVGFSEALNDASDHLSNKLDKALDLADNLYLTHGHQAVEAADGITDQEIARDYATNFVLDNLSEKKDEE